MVQPEGFQISGKENMVCKLKKSLYGLKQAPRQWYLKFDNFMGRNGFKRCEMDHCCYIKKFSKSYIILLLYVDDMLIAGSDMKEINKLKKQMSEEFEMKDLGAAKQILGMSIFRNSNDGSLTLSQEKYIGKVLEKFSLKNARARNTPLGRNRDSSSGLAPIFPQFGVPKLRPAEMTTMIRIESNRSNDHTCFLFLGTSGPNAIALSQTNLTAFCRF
ncbi:hypothetical protein E3N88_24267 [Mikania micrantha]|uniref:Reverse transcriptase Ty1/copia-type domain-containing protein n=1 Tax=Mikania micrantha TaxID=192012 RepID=A0A5N6NFJ0_9ASTR|nr:hypothetical protein E3N88_24267 [Mikania micrantha]